jgi:uncharacterized membrane protein (UPF0127 family)
MRKFLTILVLFSFWSCQSVSQNPLKSIEVQTPAGDTVKTTLVYTPKEMEQGLSGVKPEDFSDDEGMLFFYLNEQEMHFWMPDTYFDLDLIFLDKNLKILDIVRKLPHYIGRANSELIPRSRGVWSRYVLEMKASSPISAKLKIGDKLIWKSSLNLEETDTQIKNKLINSNNELLR